MSNGIGSTPNLNDLEQLIRNIYDEASGTIRLSIGSAGIGGGGIGGIVNKNSVPDMLRSMYNSSENSLNATIVSGGATGSLDYKGTWNANTNTPTFSDSGGGGNQGDYYVVSVDGSTSIDGITDWKIGDWIINNGTVWQKVDNSDAVASVFGRVGAVTAQVNDYTWAQINKTVSSLNDIATLDIGGGVITNSGEPINPHDLVDIDFIQNNIQTNLNYWLQNSNVMSTTFINSAAFITENINSSPHTCINIYFKSAVLDTLTPFEIAAGAIIFMHFNAKVDSVVGGKRIISLQTEIWHTESDGNTDPIQIGARSEATALLTDSSVLHETHIHVSAATFIAADRRLWVKFIATTDSGAADVTLSVEYEGIEDHLIIPAQSVLGNFLQKSGGNMTGDITLDAGKTVDGFDLSVVIPQKEMTIFLDGNAQVQEDITYSRVGYARTLSEVRIAVMTAPTGLSLIVDVSLCDPGGARTSVFDATQANRPEIADGAYSAVSGAPDTTAIPANKMISVSVDQVGSIISGAKIAVTLIFV